jgi:hypothetical protein
MNISKIKQAVKRDTESESERRSVNRYVLVHEVDEPESAEWEMVYRWDYKAGSKAWYLILSLSLQIERWSIYDTIKQAMKRDTWY